MNKKKGRRDFNLDKKKMYKSFIYSIWSFFLALGIIDLFLSPEREVLNVAQGEIGSILVAVTWFITLAVLIFVYYKFPNISKKIYLLFCLLALTNAFGEVVFGFFYNVEYYDKIVHFVSAIILSALVYNLFYNKVENKTYLAFFSGMIVIGIGSIWEIYEFLSDSFFGTLLTGVHIYDLSNKIKDLFMDSLDDTMYDMILNTLGALTFFIGKVVFRRKKVN